MAGAADQLLEEAHRFLGQGDVTSALAACEVALRSDSSAGGNHLAGGLRYLDDAGDLRRAEECIRVVTTMLFGRLGDRPKILHTHCRSAYGSVLCGLGRWSEGELVLVEALGPTSSVSAYHRMMTSCRLADLRILQGRLEDAAVLLMPWHEQVDALCPRARLHLAANECDLAASLARAGIAALRGDALRGAPLWSVLVSAELARKDLSAARAAAEALADLVDLTQSPVLRAEALLAAGVVAAAAGDHPTAVAHLQQARAMMAQDVRPVLRARIGHALADALAEGGQVDLAIDEARAALQAFVVLDAGPDADRTAALLRHLGAPAHRARSADPTQLLAALTTREHQVLELLCEGLTNAQIGQRLYVTTKTVEHHVSRILAKLGVPSRAQASALCARGRLALTGEEFG